MKLIGLFRPLTVSCAVLHLAIHARVDAQRACPGPFNTLKSGCQGATADQLCIEYDLREGAPSPCDNPTTKSVKNKADCARSASTWCDVVTYNAHVSKTMLRFFVTFATSSGFAPGGGFVDDGEFDVDEPGDATHSPSSTSSSSSSSGDAGAGNVVPPEAQDPILVGNGAAYETDPMVNAIGELLLPAEVNELRLIGGRSEEGTQGRVAAVDLDPDMLRHSPQITALHLMNLDIGEQLVNGDAISGFLSGVVALILANVMLTSIPPKLASLPNLEILEIKRNDVRTFPSDVRLPKVTSLVVSDCGLTSFDAVVPKVTSLNLAGNALQAIPDAVFAILNLGWLDLSRNPIAWPIVLTASQVAFLERVSSLHIDRPSDTTQPVLYPIGIVPSRPTNSPSIPDADVPVTDPTPRPATGSTPRPGDGSAKTSTENATTGDLAASGRPIGRPVDVHGFPMWLLTEDESKQYKAQQEAIAVAFGAANKITGSTSAIGTIRTEKTTEDASDSQGPGDAPPDDSSTNPRNLNPRGGPTRTPSESGGATINTTDAGFPLDGGDGVSSVANTEDMPSKKPHRKTLIWASGCGSVVAAAIVVVWIVVARRRRSRQFPKEPAMPRTPTTLNSPSSIDFIALDDNHSSNDANSHSLQSLSVDSHNIRDLFSARRLRQIDIEDLRPINASANRIVWLVRHRGARLLAAKRLVQTNATRERVAAFMNEIVVVSELDHPSITSLVGVAWSSERDLQALFEYMPNGDLDSHFQSMDASTWPWDIAKLRLAIDIVEALVYAHSFSPPLLHRDLRTRHVLLSEDNKPKLSGFRSARYASENNTMTTCGVGSARWLAPEILTGNTDYDSASDMYALGVLLCEVDTHAAPYESVDGNGTETSILELVAAGTLRPALTAHCPTEIRALATRCWSHNPVARPTALQVAFELREFVQQWVDDGESN